MSQIVVIRVSWNISFGNQLIESVTNPIIHHLISYLDENKCKQTFIQML